MRYIVRPGDTLSKIAQTHLGKASRWPEIAARNNLSNPDLIKPGQALDIPETGDRPRRGILGTILDLIRR